MTRSLLIAATSAMLVAGAPAFAAPCHNAHGKFVRCPTAKHARAAPARCRLGGKFVRCGTPGARRA